MTDTDGKIPVIAIDGPAASGKGTLARGLAEKLGYAYLDTGKLYRVVGKAVLEAGGDPDDPDDAIPEARDFRDNFNPALLSDPGLARDDVGQAASKVSAIPEVREALLQLQRSFALSPPEGFNGAVLDGRDIGTVICPEAAHKLYVTAETEIRAQRRHKELQSRGIVATYEAVLADMRQRDARDSGRQAAPLKPAKDAVVLDTSDLDASQTLEAALRIIRG